MSLRRRLVLGLVVLVGLGLLISDAGTYFALSSYLDGRADSELANARGVAYADIASAAPSYQSPSLQEQVRESSGTGVAIEVLRPNRSVLWALPSVSNGVPEAPPALPAILPLSSLDRATSFVTSAQGDPNLQYRVQAFTLPIGGYMLVLAASLQQPSQTLSRLILVEAIISIVVLLVLAIIAAWVVKVGMRPLDDIGRTARRIAGGDLGQRIRQADPRTEVGRLASSLNVMLSQIESAFADRTASEERLRRFVADASHELRTPLTSIRGYAELFHRGASKDPAALERAMTRIEGEASRMSTLVDDLLLLARLDQGRPLEAEPVDLMTVAAEAVEDARVVDPARVITLVGGDAVVVAGDEQRLRQVATNLVSNAIAHTPQGTPVHVRVRRSGSTGVLEVADEGEGLDAEKSARVFERFYRADAARGRGGAGLGLSIVAAIADAHGGHASVASQPGEGATFRVEIPLHEPGRAKPRRTDAPTLVPDPMPSSWTDGVEAKESVGPAPSESR